MDDAEARRLLREAGEDPPERARLSAAWRARAEELAGAGPGAEDAGQDGDLTGAEEPPQDTADAPEDEPGQGAVEARPRRPARPGLAGRLRSGREKTKRAKRARPTHKRVSIDRLAEHAWSALGRMAAPVDPYVSRTLQFQAPVAGLILEDTIKGTVVDRALQPLARAEEKGRKLIALAGPPMIVAALRSAQGLPDAQRQMREAFLVPMLLESLILWDDVAGEKLEAQVQREAEQGPKRDRAERIMAMIFAPPAGGSGTSEGDRAAANAQGETVGV